MDMNINEFNFASLTNIQGDYPTNEDLDAFCAANHFTFKAKAPFDPSYTSPFFMGGGHTLFANITGELHGRPFRLCRYNTFYKGDYDRNNYAIMAITLPYPMPHIIFRATLGRVHPDYLDPIGIAASQKIITADEQFNGYFQIFAPVAVHGEVSQRLLTTDFITTLLQYSAVFDIEIHGGTLYIYCASELPASQYQQVFLAATALIEALKPALDAGILHTDAQPSRLKTDRSKLGKLIAILGAFTFFGTVTVSYAVMSFVQYRHTSVGAIAALFLYIAAVFWAFRVYKKRRLSRPQNLEPLKKRFGTVNGL